MKTILALIFAFLIESYLCDSTETRIPAHYCTDLNPQNHLDVDQIMGMWYGVEVLTHHNSEEGVFYYDTCIVIHLSDMTDHIPTTTEISSEYGYGISPNYASRRRQFKYLRLIWDEKGSTLEYTLQYNESRPGFWISSAPQRGTMLDLQYHQFSGTVQVMKAVGNHLVLTFCHSISGNQLFTVVLSRKPNSLTYDEITSVRTLLKRRGLSTASIRKVCTSGATKALQFVPLTIGFLLFVLSKVH